MAKIVFQPNNQSEIASAAAEIMSKLELSLPRVPWFSNPGQQDAFRQTVELAQREANSVDADDASKEAIVFWVLALLYANNRKFRLATASVKNWKTYGISPIAAAFVSWVGTNMHPAHAIAAEIMGRQMRGIPEKIFQKITEIAAKRSITEEEASKYFQQLWEQASERYKRAGLADSDADQKALDEVLSTETMA